MSVENLPYIAKLTTIDHLDFGTAHFVSEGSAAGLRGVNSLKFGSLARASQLRVIVQVEI